MKQITSITELAALPHQQPVIVRRKSDSFLSDRKFIKWGNPSVTVQEVMNHGVSLREVDSQCGGFILTVSLQDKWKENSFEQYDFLVGE